MSEIPFKPFVIPEDAVGKSAIVLSVSQWFVSWWSPSLSPMVPGETVSAVFSPFPRGKFSVSDPTFERPPFRQTRSLPFRRNDGSQCPVMSPVEAETIHPFGESDECIPDRISHRNITSQVTLRNIAEFENRTMGNGGDSLS
jgi:hypothetical protein